MWKETKIDNGLISTRDVDYIAESVLEYLIDNVPDYEPDGDFTFEVKVEYVATAEETTNE
jgi:hypothetical protein